MSTNYKCINEEKWNEDRPEEVYQMRIDGMGIREIAEEMGVNPQTIARWRKKHWKFRKRFNDAEYDLKKGKMSLCRM